MQTFPDQVSICIVHRDIFNNLEYEVTLDTIFMMFCFNAVTATKLELFYRKSVAHSTNQCYNCGCSTTCNDIIIIMINTPISHNIKILLQCHMSKGGIHLAASKQSS